MVDRNGAELDFAAFKSCHQALAYSSRIATSALKRHKCRIIENQTTLTHVVQPQGL